MKHSRIQNVFFNLALLAFFCLLLSGGSRLIASPETPKSPIVAPVAVRASLVCAPQGETQVLAARQESHHTQERRMVAWCDATRAMTLPVTDANGNILSHDSYMHAVYQSFALGDGFV